MSNYNEEALAEGLKYIVTAGKYPHYEQKIACKSLERAEKIIDKMSDKYTDQSCLLYTSPSPRDRTRSRMPSSA